MWSWFFGGTTRVATVFLSLPSTAQRERMDRTQTRGSVWPNSCQSSKCVHFFPCSGRSSFGWPISVFLLTFGLFFMPLKAFPVWFQDLLSALRTHSSCVCFHEIWLENNFTPFCTLYLSLLWSFSMPNKMLWFLNVFAFGTFFFNPLTRVFFQAYFKSRRVNTKLIQREPEINVFSF